MAAGLGELFGKESAARQLVIWQVLAQALGAVLAPELELLTREVNKLLPSTPLSPADLATMVVRHIVPADAASAYARESGIAPADFERMVQVVGQGLAPGELAEALRRGIIPEKGTGPGAVTFEQGIAESDLKDKWTEIVKALAVLEPTPIDALNALLQGQLPLDRARELYQRFGGDLEHFQWLFDSRGSAPTPLELNEMALRGIIPWEGEGPDVVSERQGFLEGPWRDKWNEPYRQLSEYIPPPRTVTAMIREGSLTDEEGLALFMRRGLSHDLAAKYVASAHIVKTQAQRDLTQSQIIALYQDRLIDKAEATAMLASLRYSAEDAAFLLDVADFQALQAKVRTAVSKVHSLYVAHKIAPAEATTTLRGLNLPQSGIDELLVVWGLERDANVQQLSAGEIADAVFYEIIDIPTGIQRLVQLGWDPQDAEIRIFIRLHGIPQTPSGG